jgi:DNA-binding transcriptional LysR family regulator
MLTPALIGRLRVKHLEVFRHVAEQQTLRRAAECAHMTQPAATKLIQDLEEICEAQLFTRDRNGMHMTLYGRVMHRHVNLLLADLGRMAQELQLVARGAEGHIRLGVLPSLAPGLLTRSISMMLASHPRVQFTVREAASNDLIAALGRNELDIAFARVQNQSEAEHLSVKRVYSEPFTVVVRKDHPLAKRPRGSSWKDLSNALWVLPEQGTPMRNVLDQLFTSHSKLRPRAAVECTALEKVLDLIAGSDMVGVLPRSFVLHAERGRQIAMIKYDLPFVPTSLVLRQQDELAPVIEVFASLVAAAARELGLV